LSQQPPCHGSTALASAWSLKKIGGTSKFVPMEKANNIGKRSAISSQPFAKTKG
jgi:hypothetical protein